MRKGVKGFTLIEIIIVLAVLAVLAALLVPRIGAFFTRGEGAIYDDDRNTLQLAVDAYFTDGQVPGGPGIYPTYSGKGGAWSGGASGSTIKPPLLPAVT
ncbi:prepilin-type N-terminal cleavage/methylation domain-containing protein [Dehalococcoidia bacterium]|nr:prepilin-type N-terminal cleavage/methylation domain-containing protein [Dehalococcoidia bacterium]MCL0093895.1 prepilin-type N-terminal cleavage/methylation domain-containing protein [Dehalococcoidia bacterium]MCL0097586.1 prepilin-type N-terminal cleavage/methylation domain-containing protein [Dehalococcoidia bacterium]